MTEKKIDCRSKIGHKKIFLTDGRTVYHINIETFDEETELESNHEEKDTRMFFLHTKHASSSYEKILISSCDTDVFVICLPIHLLFDGKLFFLLGVKSSKRISDVVWHERALM